MGKLSTHVLDTMHGHPACRMQIELFRIDDASRIRLKSIFTNKDGRTDEPLLQHDTFTSGVYELVFHAGDYFARQGFDTPEPRFVDQVVIRFGVSSPADNYHVPLLVTPWAWSTYRGS